METDIYPTGEGYERFSDDGFCPNKPYKNFFDGICSKILDSTFSINVIQCGLVSLMYYNGNRGKYWKILVVASIAGFLGAIIENFTVAYVCRENDIDTKRNYIVTFLFAELFWITIEYAIPFLNLYKMKAFYNGKTTKRIEITIKFLFFIFAGCRFYIGYERMIHGLLTTPETKYGHMAAFGVMAISDLICTIAIICYVRRHNREHPEASKALNVDYYIKRSGYLMLICIDIVTIFLAITNGITELFDLPSSYLLPFHIMKCNFILILACDTLLFKFNMNLTTNRNEEFSNNFTFEENLSQNVIKSNNTGLKSLVIVNETAKSVHTLNKLNPEENNSDIASYKK